MRFPLRSLLFSGALAAALTVSGTGGAAELVMFERPGCAYCQRFDAEVAPIYERTDEGRRAPLRRMMIAGGLGALLGGGEEGIALASPVRYAPTFVLVDGGREIGRITGYMNEEAFWGLLGAITRDLPAEARN